MGRTTQHRWVEHLGQTIAWLHASRVSAGACQVRRVLRNTRTNLLDSPQPSQVSSQGPRKRLFMEIPDISLST